MAFTFTPNPNLFNQAFGGGVQTGQNIKNQRFTDFGRSRLSSLADLARADDFAGLGAGLIEIGQVGPGINAANVPFEREQLALQRDFQNEQFRSLKEQRAIQNELARRGLGLRETELDFKLNQPPEAPTPLTGLAKISADEQAGFITPEQADSLRLSESSQSPGNPNFSDELSLGNQFRKETKDFPKVADAFERVKASAVDPSPAGDLALIFNYMKILDPGSTVREGEFANAQNSGGVDVKIRAAYNNALNGQRLTDGQRTDFVNRAGRLFNAQANQFLQRRDNFAGIARANNFDV
jgi:hypothetical protein